MVVTGEKVFLKPVGESKWASFSKNFNKDIENNLGEVEIKKLKKENKACESAPLLFQT